MEICFATAQAEHVVTKGLHKLRTALGAQVDVASIAVFRVVYGGCCLALSLGFLSSSFLDEWLESCAVELHWQGLEWIALPCAATPLRILLAITVLASAGVMLGAFFRASAILLVAGLGYALAADQTIYSSTYYLLVLLGLWLAVSPADRAWSVDAWRRRRIEPRGAAWPLRMLQFHVAVMYVYAALAKLDTDWLAGRPIAQWLRGKEQIPLLGPLLGLDGTAGFLAWGGLAFDALVVPGLLWRRSRTFTLIVMVAFHTFNGLVFRVFPLPLIATVGALLLLPPDWPRSLASRLTRRTRLPSPSPGESAISGWGLGGLAIYALVHLLVPLRHFAYSGPVAWNEDGDEFSWRLRARTKQRQVRITLVDVDTGKRRRVGLSSFVGGERLSAIQTYPDRLLQLAHHIAAAELAAGRRVQVHVRYRVGLNGRPLRDLVAEDLDLAAQERTFLNTRWIEAPPSE